MLEGGVMTAYVEIEDIPEIRRLLGKLERRTKTQAPVIKHRSIGYPSGYFDDKVGFTTSSGSQVVWWLSRPNDAGDSWLNLIGRGNPDEKGLLLIDLQVNVATQTFSRRLGGTFVREDMSGATFLAHRGIVTRGKSRIPWARLTALTTERPIVVATSSGPREMFLVSSLDSEDLLGDIARFAQEIRAALDRNPHSTSTTRDPFEIVLRDFINEFTGGRNIPPRQAQTAVVRHGEVVKSLRDLLVKAGATQKSQKVDLFFAPSVGNPYLFEVKTGVDSTSLYTGIGQLYMYSAALLPKVASKVIHKVLVIPEGLSEACQHRVRKEIGVEVLTYAWKKDGTVKFDSLSNIALV